MNTTVHSMLKLRKFSNSGTLKVTAAIVLDVTPSSLVEVHFVRAL